MAGNVPQNRKTRFFEALMSTIITEIWQAMIAASWVEQVATVLGLLGVTLTIRQSLWNFPIGLVQVVLSARVFYQARLYADMKLQGFFFVVLAYGWWHWMRPGGTKDELVVTRLTPGGTFAHIAAGVAGTLLWGYYLHVYTDAAMPFRDAFIASFSILSQWLQARKKLENWIGWMVVNSSAVAVYWLSGLYWFAVLYLLFFVLAAVGHFEWLKSWRKTCNP